MTAQRLWCDLRWSRSNDESCKRHTTPKMDCAMDCAARSTRLVVTSGGPRGEERACGADTLATRARQQEPDSLGPMSGTRQQKSTEVQSSPPFPTPTAYHSATRTLDSCSARSTSESLKSCLGRSASGGESAAVRTFTPLSCFVSGETTLFLASSFCTVFSA